jgi:hypothetical protein
MEPCESYVVHGLNLQKLAYSFFYRLQSLDRRLVRCKTIARDVRIRTKVFAISCGHSHRVISDVDKEPFEYSSEEYQIENDDD